MDDIQSAVVVDRGDGPPVTVLHPVGGAEREGALVAAGGQRASRRGGQGVAQGEPPAHLPRLSGPAGRAGGGILRPPPVAGGGAAGGARARTFSSAASSRVGASMRASRPAARSVAQAV